MFSLLVVEQESDIFFGTADGPVAVWTRFLFHEEQENLVVRMCLWDFFSTAPLIFEVFEPPSPLHAGVEDLRAVSSWAGDASVGIIPAVWPSKYGS